MVRHSASRAPPVQSCNAVAAIGGPTPALLVHFVDAVRAMHVLKRRGGAPGRSTFLLRQSIQRDAAHIGPSVFRRERASVPRGGFARPDACDTGLYLSRILGSTPAVGRRSVTVPTTTVHRCEHAALGVSPDERSFARFGYAEHSVRTGPAVVDVETTAAMSRTRAGAHAVPTSIR